MAITVTGTGAYNFDPIGGIQTHVAGATYSFFSGLVTAADTYQNSPDPTVMDFGVPLSEIVLINNGGSSLAFQWKEAWGKAYDTGIVLSNQTIILRRLVKTGIKVRCGDSGGTTTCLIWGI